MKKTIQSRSFLNPDENQLVLSLIRPGCESYSTSMAQLFQTIPPKYSIWENQHSGVVCLEKDKGKRSYFMRMYCLKRREMVWEQKFNLEMVISLETPFFISFRVETGGFGLTFLHIEEAAYFHKISGQILDKLKKKNSANKKAKERPKIGPPENFVHLNSDLMLSDPVLTFLKSAGITEGQLKNAKLFQHIYQFVIEYGVEEILQNQAKEQLNADKKQQQPIISRPFSSASVPELAKNKEMQDRPGDLAPILPNELIKKPVRLAPPVAPKPKIDPFCQPKILPRKIQIIPAKSEVKVAKVSLSDQESSNELTQEVLLKYERPRSFREAPPPPPKSKDGSLNPQNTGNFKDEVKPSKVRSVPPPPVLICPQPPPPLIITSSSATVPISDLSVTKPVPDRGDFLKEIEKGGTLRPVDHSTITRSKNAEKINCTNDVLMNALLEKMKIIRRAVEISSSESDHSDWD